MKLGSFTLTFDFWLPWMIGPGQGWGLKWLDIGPFTVWWTEEK